MGTIKDLPGSGNSFRVSGVAGSFARKFNSAVRFGDLRNLADNKEAVLKAVKQYAHVIKIGKFDRLRRKEAYYKIKSLDKNISKEDRREIKLVLKHLGERTSDSLDKQPSPGVEEKSEKAKPIVPMNLRINRDPNNVYNFSELRNKLRPNATARVNQALTLTRPQLNGNSRVKLTPSGRLAITPDKSIPPLGSSGQPAPGNNLKLTP